MVYLCALVLAHRLLLYVYGWSLACCFHSAQFCPFLSSQIWIANKQFLHIANSKSATNVSYLISKLIASTKQNKSSSILSFNTYWVKKDRTQMDKMHHCVLLRGMGDLSRVRFVAIKAPLLLVSCGFTLIFCRCVRRMLEKFKIIRNQSLLTKDVIDFIFGNRQLSKM